MAYVALSDSNKREIRAQITRMQATEQNTLGSATITLDEECLQAVERLLWAKHPDLKDLLPSEWKTPVPRIDVRLKKTDADGNDVVNQELFFQVPPTRPVLGPPNNLATTRGYYEVHMDSLPAGKFDELLSLLELHALTRKRWEKVADDVRRFLNDCKSLNEALRLWPDLAVYVPQDLLNKVAEKKAVIKTESRAAEILRSIDTEAAVASAALARMASAATAE